MSRLFRVTVSLLATAAILVIVLSGLPRGMFSAWDFFGMVVIMSGGIYGILPRGRAGDQTSK